MRACRCRRCRRRRPSVARRASNWIARRCGEALLCGLFILPFVAPPIEPWIRQVLGGLL